MSIIDLDKLTFSLVPGPIAPPASTWLSIDDGGSDEPFVLYEPHRVADVMLSVPGALLLCDSTRDWYEWTALWDLEGATVGVGFTLFELEPPAWGGSGLSGTVRARALLDTWLHVRTALPGVWLHDGDCNVYTPEAFASRFATWAASVPGELLRRSFQHERLQSRGYAVRFTVIE